jgi:dolichyl-phosphate beta-glucosyltransferase
MFWIILFLIILVSYIVLYIYSQVIITRYKLSDYSFTEIFSKEEEKTILDKESCYLSIVVPAYNEQERVTYMLDETLQYLQKREKNNENFTWEIIIVDDGSKDKTSEVVKKVKFI